MVARLLVGPRFSRPPSVPRAVTCAAHATRCQPRMDQLLQEAFVFRLRSDCPPAPCDPIRCHVHGCQSNVNAFLGAFLCRQLWSRVCPPQRHERRHAPPPAGGAAGGGDVRVGTGGRTHPLAGRRARPGTPRGEAWPGGRGDPGWGAPGREFPRWTRGPLSPAGSALSPGLLCSRPKTPPYLTTSVMFPFHKRLFSL